MYLQELLNIYTPLPLLRACLHNNLVTSGVLDLTVVPLDTAADAWHACMMRIMTEACAMPFTDIKMHPATPSMLKAAADQQQGTWQSWGAASSQPFSPSTPTQQPAVQEPINPQPLAQQPPDQHLAKQEPRAQQPPGGTSPAVPVQRVPQSIDTWPSTSATSSISHLTAAVQGASIHCPTTPDVQTHIAESAEAEEPSLLPVYMATALLPPAASSVAVRCLDYPDQFEFKPILRSLPSVTSLDFSASSHKHAQPQYISNIIAALPALQAVTLPVFNESGVAPRFRGNAPRTSGRDPMHEYQAVFNPPSSEGFTAGLEALAESLSGLQSLQSLVMLLSDSDSYIARIVNVLADSADSAGVRSSVTRLEFIPADDTYFMSWGDNFHRLMHHTACDVLEAVSRFYQLRQLAVHVVPLDRSEPDVVADFPEYLGQFSGLTALTKLDISYDTLEGMFALIFRATSSQSVFAFLEALATTLQPLQSLKVLQFMCPAGQLRPAEYDVHLIGPENTARLEKFKTFACRLDAVVVRGRDGDATYPFASILKGVRSIQSVHIVDTLQEYEFEGCQFRSAQIATEIQNLHFLTELVLDLSHEFPEDCCAGLAESLRNLQHLRKLSITQRWPAPDHSLLLPAAGMTALQVRSMHASLMH